MLHERRLPQSDADDLNLVYQMKLSFLDWLLRTPPVQLDDSDPLIQKFGQPIGHWLWKRIHKPGTLKPFGHAVMALAGKALLSPVKAKSVATAIAHDAQFHTRWEEAGYELRFPRKHPDWLDVVRDVAEPFYDWLGDSGFDSVTYGLTGDAMTRARLMKAFRPQSHGVCGYCDGPLGEEGADTEANDCDHFFPKSKWPHLAIHPANLYSACMGCNSRWKLDKRPMGKADSLGLSETYHPMLRPGASSILVVAVETLISPRKVCIEIRDHKIPRRAETLNETLDLEVRWTNSVDAILDGDVSVYVGMAERDRARGLQVTDDRVRQLIQDDINWKRKQLGKKERTLRQVAALEYQLTQKLPEDVADFS
jgi:hypothetical protein